MSPLSSACAEVLARAEHARLGLSLFNRYFSRRIRALAAWAYERFTRVDFSVPDAPSAYTLEDLGHPAQKAAWKARRQGQCTRNKIRTALDALGIEERAGRVWGWAELEGSPAFVRLHTQGRRLYEQDGEFREACREASEWVLAGKLPEGTVPDEWQVECPVRYFLAELPLFVDTPAVVGAGASVFFSALRLRIPAVAR